MPSDSENRTNETEENSDNLSNRLSGYEKLHGDPATDRQATDGREEVAGQSVEAEEGHEGHSRGGWGQGEEGNEGQPRGGWGQGEEGNEGQSRGKWGQGEEGSYTEDDSPSGGEGEEESLIQSVQENLQPRRTIEDLLEETGSFGRFQFIVTTLLFYNKLIVGWSMYQMTFASIVPDYLCEGSAPSSPSNWSANSCSNVLTNSSGQQSEVACVAYDFSVEMTTAVSEWDLVCDLNWTVNLIESIQMAGLMVGAILAGQVADVIGRRKTVFLFVLEHSVFNLAAAFSTSWVMFAVYRFVIGVGMGAILVVAFTFCMEFLSPRWRALCASIPAWSFGVALFALTAWLTHRWDYLHFICGACGLPAALAYFYIPESPRWLTVKGRTAEAQAIINRIARTNGKPIPNDVLDVLKAVEKREKEVRENSAQYTYLDLFSDTRTSCYTVILSFEWFCMSLIQYGIAFGISALAGNVYLNIFLLECFVVPFQIVIFFTNNSCGRKLTAFPLILVSCLAAFACLSLEELDLGEEYAIYITALSLLVKTFVSVAWSVIQTWTTELYPTVTRNLGYGAANMAARVGGIVAPYIIDFENYMNIAYIVMGVMLILDAILLFWLPETKGKALANSMLSVSVPQRNNIKYQQLPQTETTYFGDGEEEKQLSSSERGQSPPRTRSRSKTKRRSSGRRSSLDEERSILNTPGSRLGGSDPSLAGQATDETPRVITKYSSMDEINQEKAPFLERD